MTFNSIDGWTLCQAHIRRARRIRLFPRLTFRLDLLPRCVCNTDYSIVPRSHNSCSQRADRRNKSIKSISHVAERMEVVLGKTCRSKLWRLCDPTDYTQFTADAYQNHDNMPPASCNHRRVYLAAFRDRSERYWSAAHMPAACSPVRLFVIGSRRYDRDSFLVRLASWHGVAGSHPLRQNTKVQYLWSACTREALRENIETGLVASSPFPPSSSFLPKLVYHTFERYYYPFIYTESHSVL